MYATVRISENLLQWIDAAIEQVKDEFGERKYRSRRDLIDDAVKRLLKELGVKIPEEVSR